MSLASFSVTREREQRVAALLRRSWLPLRTHPPAARLQYAVGALVCSERGLVPQGRLFAALDDGEVVTRALSLLAVVRYELHDGGEWPLHG